MNDDPAKRTTDKLDESDSLPPGKEYPDVPYEAVPRNLEIDADVIKRRWRVYFELLSDPTQHLGLDIYDDVVLGRAETDPDFVDLTRFNAMMLGVSRRHATIRPTQNRLFVIDLGSTNGTRRSGHQISENAPYPLRDGDVLGLGALQFSVHIVERPTSELVKIAQKADLPDALAEIAKAISSQIELDQVLEKVAESTLSLSGAEQAAVWLVNEEKGDLRLETQRGFQGDDLEKMQLSLTRSLVGEVISKGKPIQQSRATGGELLKIQTDFLVEALSLVPMSLGGMTFGALGAFHRTPHHSFSENDQRLLSIVGDLAAIAIQNARLYRVTDQELNRRIEQVSALNALTRAVSSSLDMDYVYDVLISQIQKHWDVGEALLWLLDKETNTLRPYADAEATLKRLKSTTGEQVIRIIEQVRSTGKPLASDYSAATEELNEEQKASGTIKIQAKSLACAPLLLKNEVVGAISMMQHKRGMFTEDDLNRLQAFTNPVVTAIQNAQLYKQAEHERALIKAMTSVFPQPIIILGDFGDLVIANEAAERLIATDMDVIFTAISGGIGKTQEMELGEETYLITVERLPDMGTMTVMQDITYLKQLEATRLEFVHALSHDLKSPLSSMKGFTALIARADELTGKNATYLNRINSVVDRMNSMVNQLLDIALLTEQPQASYEPCNLHDIVKKVLNDLQGAASPRNVTLNLKTSGKAYMIRGDESRLYRSVLNLVDNAIKFSPVDSSISIQLKFSKKWITIAVEDNGPGIPEEDLPHVFERYYRSKAHADKTPGFGLGLVLVAAVAQAHGGKAVAANTKNGAEFSIKLPVSLRIVDLESTSNSSPSKKHTD